MNEIVNHKTISFCWPFGPRDSGPVGKPIMPHLRRYQGFAVVHYSVTLDALYWGILDFRSIGVVLKDYPRSVPLSFPVAWVSS